MGSRSRPWLTVGLIGAGVLGVGTLVRAQQDVTPPNPPPPSLRSSDVPEPETVPSKIAPPKIVRPDAPAPDADDQPEASDVPDKPEAPAKPAIPLKRPKYAVAILQTLDKVTAETVRFEAPLNTPVRYKTLIFTVRACETTAADEDIVDAAAHVEVVSQPKAPEGGVAPPPRQIFKGWMFANSPGLNLLKHPIYDAWLIACKTEIPSA